MISLSDARDLLLFRFSFLEDVPELSVYSRLLRRIDVERSHPGFVKDYLLKAEDCLKAFFPDYTVLGSVFDEQKE